MLGSDESPDKPTSEELVFLTQIGRLSRMLREGRDINEVLEELYSPETAQSYSERNQAAMEALEQRMTSPEYLRKYAEAINEQDAAIREKLLADLKRENFATIDMEAVHRTIRARNRQMKAEGLLPPDAPT
jgi:hypothetical protein